GACGRGRAAGGPRTRHRHALAGGDARVGVLAPAAAGVLDVAADAQLGARAGDLRASVIDQLDPQPHRGRRRRRQVVPGTGVLEGRDDGDRAVLAVRGRVEPDGLTERVAIVHALPRVLAVRHVAVLALDAARHVRTFEPLLVRVEQRLAVDRRARRQLVAADAEVAALVAREHGEWIAGRGQERRRAARWTAPHPAAHVAAGAAHALGAERGIERARVRLLLGERRVAAVARRVAVRRVIELARRQAPRARVRVDRAAPLALLPGVAACA